MGTQMQIGSPAWRLAQRQHWTIASRQLIEHGIDGERVKRLRRSGHLHPLFRGVYAVGRPQVSWRGWWMAAVLACGPDAVLTPLSAAALWRIRLPARPLHVTAPRVRRPQGIVTHRRVLRQRDIVSHHGIPVTGVVCTLIDIAPDLTPHELETAINDADRLPLVDPETLRATLVPRRGRPGIAKLRQTLDRRPFVLADSELERLFLPIAERAGLPRPLTQARLNDFRVDFYWPDLGIVVETDGLRYHRTPAQQGRDRLRDQTHAAAGLIPLRFTHSQIRYEPAHVHEVLVAVAAPANAMAGAPPAPPAAPPGSCTPP